MGPLKISPHIIGCSTPTSSCATQSWLQVCTLPLKKIDPLLFPAEFVHFHWERLISSCFSAKFVHFHWEGLVYSCFFNGVCTLPLKKIDLFLFFNRICILPLRKIDLFLFSAELASSSDNKTAVYALMDKIGFDRQRYRLGHTIVFFRAG